MNHGQQLVIQFLKIITSENKENAIRQIKQLNIINNNFDCRYIHGLEGGKYNIENLKIENNNYIVLIENMEYRIILNKNSQVNSFEFLCMGCFNDELSDKSNCDVCGGKGWEVL